MILTIIIGTIIGLYFLTEAITSFMRKKIEALPYMYGPDTTYEPTEYDKGLITQSEELIKKHFPNGIEKTMLSMTVEQRVDLFKTIIEEVAELYGVDIQTIEFLTNDKIGAYTRGCYDYEEGKVAINLDILSCSDGTNLFQIVGTIFHECRHALQYRAIIDENFTEISEETAGIWAMNYINYIPADLDECGYYYQAVEFDARNFADTILAKYKEDVKC